MDPLSITVSVVGLIGAVKACLKLAGKFVGPSKLGKAELADTNSTLYEALGILKSFKTFLKLHDDDDGRLQALVHLGPVMERCQQALQCIKAYMQDTSAFEKIWKGAKFDKTYKNAIKAVGESSKLFKLAVMADQHYLHVMGKDIEAIKMGQEEIQNGSGKSHICSKAIDSVSKTQDVYLYYFYRFDYQLSTSEPNGNTANENKLRMSSLLIDQLLRQLWRDDPTVANRICQFIEIEEKNTKTLAEVVQILLKRSSVEQTESSRFPRQEDFLRDADSLLLYFAKFWTKHIEDIEPTPDERKAVTAFANSSNFQTLLQVQSLTVADQFEQIAFGACSDEEALIMGRDGYHHLQRQSFPKWLFHHKNSVFREYVPYRGQYRHFVNEWGYLLTRATSPSDQDYFPGEVERCLSGMMGPSSFLSHMKEKYSSFMLSQEPFDCTMSNSRVLVERLSRTGDQFTVVSAVPRQNLAGFLVPIAIEPDPSPLFIRIETWDLTKTAMPCLISTSNVSAADLSETLGRTASVSVTPKEYLKEGYIWLDDLPVPDHESNPMLLHEKQTRHDRESISFDFRTRDNIVMSARRSKYKTKKVPHRFSQQHKNKSVTTIETRPDWSSSESDSPSSEDDDDNAAEETCSEGSTDFDSDEASSDDGTGENDASSAEATADEDSSDDSYDSSSSYDEDGYPKPSRKGSRQRRKETLASGIIESNLAFDEEEGQATRTRERPISRLSQRKNMVHASLSVYDMRSGHPIRLFSFKQDLPVMLYSSPPALHPSKSLVAWPLGGGDILFADYMANTFFIRGAVPNTQDSRHITMQSHFSTCGKYLHIASIEARIVEKHKSKSDRYGEEPGSKSLLASKSAQSATIWATDPNLRSQELVLSAFVTTHRLSGSKTTRSPPRLIHRAIVGLGRYAALSLDNLPITFNWAPKYVYLSLSGHRLNVIRIRLFRSRPSPQGPAEPVACAPRLPVMLPLSATGRQIHYLPPKSAASDDNTSGAAAGAGTRGIVLMGSYGGYGDRVQLRPSVEVPHRDHCGMDAGHTMPYPCPAVGFYVDEERDFGGWLPYEAEGTGAPARGEKFRDGRLVMRKMEGFSAQDDIDLEGICFIFRV
ncbi:hypothetical protein SLS63_009164 [Diaporthe eres]|uniref:Fungal N-terminal domain-containing protein n=1 Tax=Diaporthe eres TaxID=83184 RepID=A0ABR1P0D4_DIAER